MCRPSLFLSAFALGDRGAWRSLPVWSQCDVTASPVAANKEASFYANTHQSMFIEM